MQMQSFISVGLRLDKIQGAGLTRALAGHHSLAVSVLPDGSRKLATVRALSSSGREQVACEISLHVGTITARLASRSPGSSKEQAHANFFWQTMARGLQTVLAKEYRDLSLAIERQVCARRFKAAAFAPLALCMLLPAQSRLRIPAPGWKGSASWTIALSARGGCAHLALMSSIPGEANS